MSKLPRPDPDSFNLAGTSGGGSGTFNTSQLRAEVTLMREPLNNYDKQAIAVYLDGIRVGYVPRDTNQWINKLILEDYHWHITNWELESALGYPLIQITCNPR